MMKPPRLRQRGRRLGAGGRLLQRPLGGIGRGLGLRPPRPRRESTGNTRLNEIAQSARVGDARATARYLDLLQQMRVVRRVVPATASRPDKVKRGIYQIADPFLRFWFRRSEVMQ